MDAISPGVGHNSDPFLETKARVDALIDNANRWLGERPQITDDDMAGKCSDFIEQLTRQAKAVETDRLEANKPLREAIAANDKIYKPLVDLLETAKKLLKTRLTPWLQEKERRRIEAAKKAEEEALEKLRAAEAARKEADRAITVEGTIQAEAARKEADRAIRDADRLSKSSVAVQGDFGSRARGLRTVHYAEIVNWDLAVAHYRDHPKIRDLIQDLANADARNPEKRIQPVPGVRFTSRQEAA